MEKLSQVAAKQENNTIFVKTLYDIRLIGNGTHVLHCNSSLYRYNRYSNIIIMTGRRRCWPAGRSQLCRSCGLITDKYYYYGNGSIQFSFCTRLLQKRNILSNRVLRKIVRYIVVSFEKSNICDKIKKHEIDS